MPRSSSAIYKILMPETKWKIDTATKCAPRDMVAPNKPGLLGIYLRGAKWDDSYSHDGDGLAWIGSTSDISATIPEILPEVIGVFAMLGSLHLVFAETHDAFADEALLLEVVQPIRRSMRALPAFSRGVSGTILRSAQSLLDGVDEGSPAAAIMLAQTSIEVGTERALFAVADDVLQAAMRFPLSINLGNEKVCGLWNAAFADKIQESSWWGDFKEHTRRRNQIAHGGLVQSLDESAPRPPNKDEAGASVRVADELLNHVHRKLLDALRNLRN